MTRTTKFLLLIAALVVLASASSWFALWQADWSLYEERIPAQFEIEERVLLHSEGLGSCGFAVFRLSAATVEKTVSRQHSFLATATVARVPHDYPYENYSHYDAWRSTPVPDSWRSEGDAAWMYCPLSTNDTIVKLIHASKAEGSYYTSAPGNQKMFLAPSLGLILYAQLE